MSSQYRSTPKGGELLSRAQRAVDNCDLNTAQVISDEARDMLECNRMHFEEFCSVCDILADILYASAAV